MRKVTTLALIASGLVALGCGAGSTAPTSSAPATTATADAAEAAETKAPDAQTPTTTAPATKAPAKPTWKTVATLKGSGNKRGQVFHLGDGQARLTYTIKGGQFATAAIYVVEKGKSLAKDGGFPEVMADAAGKDTTELAGGEGDYYLDVKAANCTWTITVQELR
ncbi:hypothetical protein [Micromonospora chersina]